MKLNRLNVVRWLLRAALLIGFMYLYVKGIMSLDWQTIDLEGSSPLEVKMLLFIMNFSVAFIADRLLIGLFSMVEFIVAYYQVRKKWTS